MKKAVLLGTSHTIQRGNNQKGSFESYIGQLCDIHNINAIAEEIDDQCRSIAAGVSDRLNIMYKIIEPTLVESEKLGIEKEHHIRSGLMNINEIVNWPDEVSANNLPSDVYEEYTDRIQATYRKRESEWLKRINELNSWPVLIICGADHYQPFYQLLISSSIDVIKVNGEWGLQI